MISEYQKQNLLKNYTQWVNNEETGFDLDNINRWLIDFKKFQNYFTACFNKYITLYSNKKVESEFDNFLELIYNTVNKYADLSSNQTLNEVKNFFFWDINVNSITVTIVIDKKNFNLRLSDYFNGYAKIDGIELSEPFEDMECTTLKFFAEEELQKTKIQMLNRIEELIKKPLYDELTPYEQGIRDMINFMNNESYATSQGVYFHILDTFIHNHSKEYKAWEIM